MNTDQIILQQFIATYPVQAAQALEKLQDEDLSAFISEMPVELNVKILHAMSNYKISNCIPLLDPGLASELIEKVDVQFAELLLRHIDEPLRNKLLDNIPSALSSIIKQKLKHPAHSVGALMTPVIFTLRKEVTSKEAITIVRHEKDKITPNVYVADADGKLEGIVKLYKLLYEEKTLPVSSIMNTEVPKFITDTPVKSVVDHPGWQEYQSIPVVDKFEKLVGEIKFETIQKNKLKTDQELSKHVVEASSALGELYRIGLTGFLHSVTK